jgi:glycosyltransferase involved in cell wall biosynthesis
LFAELKAMELAKEVAEAEVVTYRQREAGISFLPDLLKEGVIKDRIFVVSWGFDVPKLVKQLARHHIIYHAHSSSYGFSLPSRVPIVTVSRNTMGYWGEKSPHAPIYYLPNQISDEFKNREKSRDIDVLVQARKSSSYLKNSLIPALQKQCRVEVITGFVPDLASLFDRSRVYLYDSAEYWAQQRVTEGFGLPPMEAIACGCHVFSSVNHALADYLDPGINCQKISTYSRGYDIQRILNTLQLPPMSVSPEFFREYRAANIIDKWQIILTDLNEFFDYIEGNDSDIEPLTPWRLQKMRWQSKLAKLKNKLARK